VLLGVGTDIISIERMRSCIDSSSFMQRTFTEGEIQRAGTRADEGSYYALVFAGKEAIFKCFGIPGEALGGWKNIEVVEDEHGQPGAELHGIMALVGTSRGVKSILLSLSYETEYAIAFAAVETAPPA
jgi:holo-[acyl-carrier protein] synthase